MARFGGMWLFLAVMSAMSGLSNTQQQPVCDSVLDLVFVLDGSNSVTRRDFKTITDTVASVIQDLSVSEDQIQVGVVEFASSVGDTIDITGNEAQLLADLAALQKTDSGTGTHLAIERALQLLENSRPNISDAIVIVTDGATDEPADTNNQVQIAVTRGVPIFAIGIGSRISMEDLISLASGRTDRVSLIENANALLDTLNNITRTVCQQIVTTTPAPTTTTPAPTTPAPPPPCEIKATNVWFVLDQTNSVLTGPGATLVRAAMVDFIDRQEFAPYRTSSDFKVGVVTYSTSARVTSPLNSIQSTTVIFPDPALAQTAASNTYLGLERVLQEPLNSNAVNWIVLVSAQGQSGTLATRAINVATQLKNSGYLISVLGVGASSSLNEAELREVASENQYRHLDSYLQLADALYNFLRQRLCNQVDNPCSECTYETMINIVPSPDTCAQFYQCLPNFSYIVKDCGMGTLFNDQPGHRTCEHLPNFSCPSWGQCTANRVEKFPALCCGEYYDCNMGAVTLQQCPADRPLFNSIIRECVANPTNDQCVNDPMYCRSAFSNRDLDSVVCDNYRPFTGNVCKFEKRTADGSSWLPQDCAIGTGWNQTVCTCDHNPACIPKLPDPAAARSNDLCAAMIHLTFNEAGVNVMDDTVNEKRVTWVQKNKVTFTPRSANFGGTIGKYNDMLYIPYFSNNEWPQSFAMTIRFRFAESAQVGMDYDILANDRCGECTPSLYLRARRGAGNERVVTFQVTDISGTVLVLTGSVNVNQVSDWVQVNVMIENLDVMGKIEVLDENNNPRAGQSATLTPSTSVTKLMARVKVVFCGMAIGQGPNNAFMGDVEDFQYIECDAPSRRLL